MSAPDCFLCAGASTHLVRIRRGPCVTAAWPSCETCLALVVQYAQAACDEHPGGVVTAALVSE